MKSPVGNSVGNRPLRRSVSLVYAERHPPQRVNCGTFPTGKGTGTTLFVSKGLFVVTGIIFSFCSTASAEVVVLANRTNTSQTFTLLRQGEASQSMTLPVGESRPYFFGESVRIRFGQGLSQQSFQLAPKSIYFFSQRIDDNTVQLEKIGLGPQDYDETVSAPRGSRAVVSPAVLPVKLLVDDDEATHKSIWEPRIRARLAEASQVMERHSGVRFKVVAIGTWESDDSQHDFSESLREFERKVTPKPGLLAIGFSSQYQVARGRVHMGVTRGVMHPYILLKERAPNILEPERVQLLVHEMGHFLGASHSPEPQSVMLPMLAKGSQRRVGSRIQFDPVNTLLMAMVGDEIRSNGLRSAVGLSRPTRERMLDVYRVLAEAMPEDPAASQYQQMIGRVRLPPLVEETRLVLRQLVRTAKSQQDQSQANLRSSKALKGDELTSFLVRRAATIALQGDPKHRTKAFLLAMGIFVDDTNTLRSFPLTSRVVRHVESELERRERVGASVQTTVRGRHDLAKHFFVSAHALAVMGSTATRGAGLAKEMLDADRGTGFSFADMAANRAGIIFAEQLLADKISLEEIALDFRVVDYMPEITELEEGLRLDDLQERLAGNSEGSLAAGLSRIEQRILELAVYAKDLE